MSDNRRTGLTEEELESLADKLMLKMEPSGQCKLTEEQQRAVVDLIAMKKKTVHVTLWIVGALIAWILKDVYLYIVGHIAWGGK